MRRESKCYFMGCLATLLGVVLIGMLDCHAVIEITASTIIIFIGATVVNVGQ